MRVIRTFGSHPYFRIVESQRLHPRTVCARPAEYFHNHHHHHHQQQHDCRNQQHHNGQQEHQHQHPQESQQQQRHEGVARYYDLTEAFDQMHRDFFRGFPMRRYVHSDLFHRLDEQFAQEYNRLAEQQQAARKTNSAANAADTKNTTSAESQNKPFNKESNKVTNQQSNTGKQDVAEHAELDLYPFFRSPFHLRNLEQTFEEERQRLSKVMEEFQERMNAQAAAADPSKTRTIKENYQSTPEGYVHEFSDSRHPKRNFSIDTRKKQALSDEGKTSTASSHTTTTTTTNQRTSQSFEKEQQQHKPAENTYKAQEKTMEKAEEVAQKQQQYQQQQQQEILSAKQTFEQTHTTSQNQAAPEPVVKTEEVQNNSAKNLNEGRIDISPELNQKAKQLSIMLNKDYLESLELARVYTNKSVGQIIDLVLAAQQEQTY